MPLRPRTRRESPPDWGHLYRIAESQSGYFSRVDAAGCGFSSPLLHHHVSAGAIQRARRGVYRLTRFPTSDIEDLVVLWLWSKKVGTFSHETALALHELSDALPSRAHITLPEAWRSRRLTVPTRVIVHYSGLASSDRAWFQAIPITRVERTIRDLVVDNGETNLIRQAISQARRRGLVPPGTARQLAAVLSHRSRAKASK
jgi:predicted transcriptional regulator of viral defense system